MPDFWKAVRRSATGNQFVYHENRLYVANLAT